MHRSSQEQCTQLQQWGLCIIELRSDGINELLSWVRQIGALNVSPHYLSWEPNLDTMLVATLRVTEVQVDDLSTGNFKTACIIGVWQLSSFYLARFSNLESLKSAASCQQTFHCTRFIKVRRKAVANYETRIINLEFEKTPWCALFPPSKHIIWSASASCFSKDYFCYEIPSRKAKYPNIRLHGECENDFMKGTEWRMFYALLFVLFSFVADV